MSLLMAKTCRRANQAFSAVGALAAGFFLAAALAGAFVDAVPAAGFSDGLSLAEAAFFFGAGVAMDRRLREAAGFSAGFLAATGFASTGFTEGTLPSTDLAGAVFVSAVLEAEGLAGDFAAAGLAGLAFAGALFGAVAALATGAGAASAGFFAVTGLRPRPSFVATARRASE